MYGYEEQNRRICDKYKMFGHIFFLFRLQESVNYKYYIYQNSISRCACIRTKKSGNMSERDIGRVSLKTGEF